jgi:hypothetical protein
VLRNTARMLPWPVLALAVATAAWGALRRRRAETLLTVVATTWIVADLAMAWRGYSSVLRYMVPVSAMAATLAAIGAGRLLAVLPDRRLGGALAAAAAVAVAVAFAPTVRGDLKGAAAAAGRLERLDAAIGRVGGPAAIAACGGAATSQDFRAGLAWDLDVPIAAVVAVHRSGLIFVAQGRPHRLPLRHPEQVHLQRLGELGHWKILRATPRDSPPGAQNCRLRPLAAE